MKHFIHVSLLTILLFVATPSVYAAFPIQTKTTTSINTAVPVQLNELATAQTIQQKQPAAPRGYGRDRDEPKGYSIASFCCAIVGLLVAGIPLGIAAIILGVVGVGKGLRGLAIAGIIIGVIDIIGVLLFLASR
jgi:hypothetical protein